MQIHGLFSDSSLQRIALFRALQLGDLLCAVPALRALRAAAPRADITLIGLPWAREFAQRFRCYLDHFVAFPGYPGLPEQSPRVNCLPEFLAVLQEERFDLVIQMHGGGVVTNPLISLFGARLQAGFYRPGMYCPDERYFLAYPEDGPEVRRLLRLVEFLGAPVQGDCLEFPLSAVDYYALAAVEETLALRPGSYICVHPGARLLSRRWKPERFAAVADALARQGLQVVLTGAAEEVLLADAVARAMRAPALNVAGRTSLGALGALLSGASLLICNDTGVSHLAAALRVPSVVIVSGSDPNRWAPLDRERHRVVAAPVACRPCHYWSCPIGHPCADGVTVEAVVAEADVLLQAQSASDGVRHDAPVRSAASAAPFVGRILS